MTAAPGLGDLVVYRTPSGAGVARVELLRERHVTAFPWRQADRRWERRLFKIDRRELVKVLPGGADPTPIADQLNSLRNRRDAERMAVQRTFEKRIQQAIAELDGRP